MMYLLALTIAVSIGVLAIRLITQNRLARELNFFLGAALGLGITSQIIFYVQLVGYNFNHFLPVAISFALLGVLLWLNKTSARHQIPRHPQKNWCLALVLSAVAIPLWLEANHYPLGGWDAWSCWNLKSKFIYLGEHAWKDMFDPVLWRSNTGYPLALPTLNVWFWQWTGWTQQVSMYNAIVITLLNAGVLLSGLCVLGVSTLYASLITFCIFTLSFGNTLCISQYSDILFSLYLLSAFVCYFYFEKSKDNRLLILTAIFIGLLSFTKNEGIAASGILSLLILLRRPQPWLFIIALVISALPTIIFTLTMAPHGGVFINGLLSADHPSSGSRLIYILTNTLYEFISMKWAGLWIIAAIGLTLSKGRSLKQPLVTVGLFMICFLTVTLTYYQINTFFDDIRWWMDNTLNRIVFALMPSVFLWMGLSLFKKDA